jgi:G3E family GTPase
MASAVPLTVLTGFLGSGKTTLLKRLLEDPGMAGTAVLINEFGEVGLDHALIEKLDDDAVLLPSGCVCCAVRGDLVEALEKLHTKSLWGDIPPMRRALLETTGLADPTPIVHTLMTEERVYRIYQLDGVVTTVDAQLGLTQIDEHFEPAKQIAIADRLVITKTDLAAPEAIARLRARLGALNRAAPIREAVKGDVPVSELIGLGAHEPAITDADPERWLSADKYVPPAAGTHEHDHHGHDHDCHDADCQHPQHHEHLHGIQSFCLAFDEPLDGGELSNALQLLAQLYGGKLLRVKGIVNVKEQANPFVIHGVQHIFYPPDSLQRWPSESRTSRLVFITKDLPESTLRRHFKPFLGEAVGAAA